LRKKYRTYNIATLAKGIIHEIRNPLNSVYVNLQLLEEEINSKNKNLREILMQIKMGLSQIDGILSEFARFVRESKSVLKKEDINLLLNNVLKFVEPECRQQNIKIIKCFQEDLPMVWIDANQLKQAILNLILNANQAMLDGGMLTVTTYLSRDKKKVCIDIHDTGIGISEKDMPRIFDLFYSTKANGTGLGLPIVQKIIHDHNGKIRYSSEKNKGTTFTVILPIKPKNK
jgi:signal transduction histidine kinase